MTYTWSDIQWIFEPDGALRDIYVQDASLADWEKLIDFINTHYSVSFGEEEHNQIDKAYVLNYLQDETGAMACKIMIININDVHFHCYFFLADQIEFDIVPQTISSLDDFVTVQDFMLTVSKVLHKQVILTGENTPEFPLCKIDFDKGVNIVLTKKMAEELYRK